jgi:hypothetical protein
MGCADVSLSSRQSWVPIDCSVHHMPTTIKIVQTLFVCMIVPVYWRQYGPQNFLWISDTALIVSVVALWLNSSLLASMEALSVFIFELLWLVEVLFQVISGHHILGLSKYMFQRDIPLWIRLLSLFHVWMPWLLLWMVLRYGYNGRALVVQTVVWYAILLLSYFVSTPQENINFAHGFVRLPTYLTMPGYLALMMVAVPACIYVPTHFLMQWLAKK